MDLKAYIIEEYSGWLAINKPSGLIVEKNPYENPTIEDIAITYLTSKTNKSYVGIVHRLDRVTSGVLLLAKNKRTLRALNQQFADRTIQKIYWALVSQKPPTPKSTLVHWLEKDQRNKKAIIHDDEAENRQKVSLSYEIITQKSGYYLLKIIPHTGKFHQIRAQLSAIACPIIGDEKYGSTIDPAHRHIALHARELKFTDPNNGQISKLTAPVPNYKWWNYFGSIS